ncbi:MAG: hypothetical protein JWQ78_700 [Sediminibacterium sp.]|nr:hypothetical protein [Sediminibacterium sp.]
MELNKFSPALQELTLEESNAINGGETLWYWVAFTVTSVVHGVITDLQAAHNGTYRQSAGSAAMHSALG